MGLAILKLWLWLASFSKPRITDLAAPLQHRFFVWPLDLDENLHMNNSRYLNYMELARWDLNIRSGFLKYALKHKIMAPVLNTAIVYRRSLGPLQTFCVDTNWCTGKVTACLSSTASAAKTGSMRLRLWKCGWCSRAIP